ncbi:diguanylate cyclase domain-containing protein [Cytobacillus sp. IB215665]|uniref:sensor domain-containing diguanylate cyclase n=1 Tax=Cytobacillus sp. IB215665 TaxID=3097357 RepID=UPI002A164BF3|nr:diguanylate cyclase [Cytobacillus sp. IB215665]MDX8367506.1 diguanylate cyclase [Cytobacillus sp. IB215665]
MELVEEQIYTRIKAELFDLLLIDDNHSNYHHIPSELTYLIKTNLQALEVSLFLYNHEIDRFFLEASTMTSVVEELDQFFISSEKILPQLLNKIIIRQPLDVLDQLGDSSVTIPFSTLIEENGFLLIKQSNVDEYSNQFLQKIGRECEKFVNQVRKFTNIINEEKRYEQLNQITAKFHSSMSIDSVLEEIIETLEDIYPLFTHHLLLSHDNNNQNHMQIKDLNYDDNHIHGFAMKAYVNGEVFFEQSVKEKQSILYAPLMGKQGVYGVLQVTAHDSIVFPKREVDFIILLANTAGSAIENAQLYQQSKRLIADLQLINATSHTLNSNLRLREIMAFMTDQMINSFNAQEVGFVLIDDNNQLAVLPGSTSFFETKDCEEYIHFIHKKIKGEMDSIFIGELQAEHVMNAIYRSLMSVPMVHSEELKGFALVLHRQPHHFTFEYFKLMQSLIHHSTLAFSNSMLREELEKLVITDHLTKLYSRKYLDEKILYSLSEDHQGTLLLIDIDNFKEVNDTYGHQVGDDILIQVADIIKMHIREKDIGARWGGEEFAIYLPTVDCKIGKEVAKRLIKKIENGTNPTITISCGLSYWGNDYKSSLNDLIFHADKALYKAKGSGKNQLVTYNVEK